MSASNDKSPRFSTILERTQHEEIVRLRSQLAQLQQGSDKSSSSDRSINTIESVSVSLVVPPLPVENKSEENGKPELSDPKSESDNEIDNQESELDEPLVKELLRELCERFEYMYGFLANNEWIVLISFFIDLFIVTSVPHANSTSNHGALASNANAPCTKSVPSVSVYPLIVL